VTDHVNPVHQLYMDLSGRYRAGWTFHRFLQGLQKFFGGRRLEDHTADFEELHGELREASQRLNDPEIRPVMERLEQIRSRVDRLLNALDQEDRHVDPSLVRLFLRRVRNYDERILLDLVRFFIEIQKDVPWQSDRLDKVDFLVTRLAERVSGEGLQGDRSRLSRVLAGLSDRAVPTAEYQSRQLTDRQEAIAEFRQEARRIDSLDELTERDLVGRYRQFKHALGGEMLEREMLPLIVDTNVELARKIRDFASAEEQRILRDYERIATHNEAEIGDLQLESSVSSLDLQISRFRKQLESGRVRLDDMVLLRESVVRILERIEGESADENVADGDDVEDREPVREVSAPADMPIIEKSFRDLVGVLGPMRLGGEVPGKSAGPEIGGLVENRELQAFRRLVEETECNEALERLLLAAAALRLQMTRELERTDSSRRRSPEGREGTDRPAGAILELGSLLLRRFEHEMEMALLRGQPDEARDLQLLRMRLMRDYSELWLAGNA
jgi:hypothetical protein